MIGRYVVFTAGRGKGRVFVVTGMTPDGRVICSDGATRKQSEPKIKNQKHVRLLDGTARLPSTDRELAKQIGDRLVTAGDNLIINGRDYSAER